MSLTKFLDRFSAIHHKIKTRSTGTPKQLASSLNISESRLLDNIADLKSKRFPIDYDNINKTYFYSHEFVITDIFEYIYPSLVLQVWQQ